MADAKINIEVGYTSNKQEFDKVNKQLEDLLVKVKSNSLSEKNPQTKKQLEDLVKILEKASIAYEQAFNSKTGQINISKLNEEMKKTNVTVEQFRQAMSKAGQEGAAAYNSWAASILNTNIQLKQSNQLLDRMAVTFKNTVRYGISSSIFNNFTNSIQKAYDFTKNLDTSLNDIRIVSNKSAEEMERLAISANKAAQSLGRTTLDYTKAATIYYQQGLSNDEVEKRTELTLKAANVTGQNAQEVSEQLTAVWNGYQVTGEALEDYVDKLAAVAASTAADLEELSTGMSKVASAAHVMGVDIDQLNAQMATIISVTKQAPESVGTALRTIYARIADIKAGLDDEVSLGNYSGKMKKLGIDVLDASGNLREMGDVIEEIGGKWESMSREQQVNLAQIMAGTRQYNNLLTLFDNWDMYEEALETSANSAGALQKQQDIYMESTEAHLKQLQAETEELYNALFNQEEARAFIDLVREAVDVLGNYITSLGGGLKSLIGLGSQFANIFSGQISAGIAGKMANTQRERENQELYQKQQQIIAAQPLAEDFDENNAMNQSLFSNKQKIDSVRGVVSAEQYKDLIAQENELYLLQKQRNQEITQYKEICKTVEQLEKDYAQELKEINDLIAKGGTDRKNLDEQESARLDELLTKTKAVREARAQKDSWSGSEADDAQRDAARAVEIQGNIDKTVELAKQQQAVNTIVKSTTALIMMATTAQSVFNIAFDKNISTWDKFKSITGILVMQLPTILTSLTAIKGIIPAITTLTKAHTAAENGANAARALRNSLDSTWLALGIAVAIGAAVLAVGSLINEIIKANDAERQLNAAIEQTKEDIQAATDRYEELKSTISNYTTAKNGIDQLTKGTVEFYDAILKANQEAQKLIDEFGLISGQDYTFDENGLININQDTLDDITFKKQQSVYQSNSHLTSLQLEKNERELSKLYKQFNNTFNSTTGIPVHFNDDQIRKILTGSDGDLGKLDNWWTYDLMNGWQTKGNNTWDTFTEEQQQKIVEQYRPQLNALEAERKNYESLLAQQTIRGFGRRQDVETYNSMSSEARDIFNAAFAKAKENADYKDITYAPDYEESDKGLFGLRGAFREIGNSVHYFHDSLWGNKDALKNYYEREGAQFYRENYARDHGYKQKNGTWYKNGEEVNLKDEIDTATAVAYYNNVDLFNAEEEVERLSKIYSTSALGAKNKGLSKSSQDLIATGMLAASTGQEFDYSILNDKDRKELLRQIWENSLQVQSPHEKSFSYTLGEDYQSTSDLWNLTKNRIHIGEEYSEETAKNDPMYAAWARYLSSNETAYDEIARGGVEQQSFNEQLKANAQELDVSTTALEVYGIAMKNAGKLTGMQTAEMADQIAASYTFNKAYNDSVKIYEKNTDAIDDWIKASKNQEQVSYETADAIAELVDSLEGVFGRKVSAKFVTDNIETVKTMLTGTEEEAKKAYESLQALADADLLRTTFGDNIINGIFKTEQALNDFAAYFSKLDVGGEVDQEYANKLIRMVNASKMTQEQIEELFRSMHLEVPDFEGPDVQVTENTVPSTPQTTTTHHDFSGTMPIPDGNGGYTTQTIEGGWGWDETITTNPQKIYTLNKDLKLKSTGGSATGGTNFKRAPSTKKKNSGSSSKPTKKDLNKDELDRYQLVNVQLKEISKQLSKLDKEKKKLLGGNLVANLNKQIRLLNDQMDVTERKLKIAKGEQAEVAKTLSGYGIKFDEDGNIANYKQIFQREQAKLNAVYTKFNGMSKKSQEAYQNTVKAAEETWKKFKESITKYDNLIGDTIPGLEQDLADSFDKRTEILIEEFNAEIKVRLDMSEAERDWNEFKRKVIDGIKDDDILGMATAKLKDFSSYFNSTSTGEVQALTKQLQGQLEELRKQDENEGKGQGDWYKDNRAQAMEDLKDNLDKIEDSLTAVVELAEEMQQKLLDAMDQAQEKFEEQVDTFENINKQLEHNVELIQLLTDENNYEALTSQYAAQTRNRQEELDFYTKEKDFWENYLTTLEEGTEEWENAKAKYNEAAEAWSSALTTTIQTARREFENNINLIFKTINNQLTNNKGLDYLNEEWTLLGENSELVLDNINKMQGLQDLSKKYTDAINSTSNIKAQQKLAELRDSELESLKAMDALSEKDLERAEKKLNIVKAQIALEDAQRNKSQMRLRRDSQGNYRYQFVADEEEVQQAQQNLYSAYNELYNFDKSRYTNTLNEAAKAWSDYQQKMAEAALINDPEKRAEKEALIKSQYDEKIGILHEQLQRTMQELNQSTFAELNALYGENEDNYALMTEEQQAALSSFENANQTAFDLIFDLYTENTDKFHNMTQDQIDVIQNQMVPQWTSGYQALVDAIEAEGGIEEVSNRLMNELQEATDHYNNTLSTTENIAGQAFSEITDAQNDIIKNNKEMLAGNQDLVDSYSTLIEEVKALYYGDEDAGIEGILTLMDKYNQAWEDAKETAKEVYDYWKDAKGIEAGDYEKNVNEGPETGNTGSYREEQNNIVQKQTKTEPNLPFDATIPKGTQLYSASGSKYNKTQANRAVTVQALVGSRYQVWGSTFNPHVVYVDKNAIKYDTGGYTGAWGKDGRLAMLHEKELVLNKKDTANMLDAIEILRGITDNIGADVLNKMTGMRAGGLNSAFGGNTLDQNVHIEATFPGVTSSIEIQDALNNLVNMAAQRAQVK